MKAMIVSVLSILILADAQAQGVFDNGKDVFRGFGDDQTSKPFTMHGPFVLSWTLIDKPPAKAEDRRWRKPYGPENPAWISLRIFDSKTNEKIEWVSRTGMEGKFAINKAGTFYLMATSYDNVEWIIRAKDGKLSRSPSGEAIVPATAEEKAAARGEPMPQANAPAPSTQPATATSNSKWNGIGLPPGMQRK